MIGSTREVAATALGRRPVQRPGAPPRLRGGLPFVGHMHEFARNPFALLMRARAECGDVVEFSLLNQRMVLLTGPQANEAFFRAPDDQICRREAYKLMTPIFGEGVVFDAPGPRLGEQIRMVMQFLRDHRMRDYPPTIENEVRSHLSTWGERGQLDLLTVMKDLTLAASSRCLIGDEFRNGMDREFRVLYEHLEKGVNPLAYFQPHLPLPSFRRRDSARVRLVERVETILRNRERTKSHPDDGLQALFEASYKDGKRLNPHEITGILIAIMMAGHHTSAGTGAWVIVELLRNREFLTRVQAELDQVWPEGEALSFGHLRKMRFLFDVIKEVLRLHPPLIFLLRKVLRDFHYDGYVVPAGDMLCVTPAVSHRIEKVFPHPDRFDPDRFATGVADAPFAWIPFGGGKNKCTGNAFGMLQLKAVVAVLLRHYDFELAQAPARYRDDYNSATVMPKPPVTVRYARRKPTTGAGAAQRKTDVPLHKGRERALNPSKPVRIAIDLGLCQGHSACLGEAPDIFHVTDDGEVEVLDANPSPERYAALVRAAEHCPNKVITLEQ